MHGTDVHHLLEGRLLFRDFRYYRTLPFPIGDADEGQRFQYADNYRWSPGDGTNPFGPALTVVNGIAMDGLAWINEVYPTPISCYSVGEFEQLAGDMVGAGPEQYDAAVEILDVQTLLNAIYTAGVFVESGELVRQTHQPSGEAVQYVEIGTPDKEGHLAKLIFRKPPSYAHQREYRMMIRPHVALEEPPPIQVEPIIIQIPKEYHWLLRRLV